MVLVDRQKMKRDFVRRLPMKRDIIEIRSMGRGLNLLGTGLDLLSLQGGGMDEKLKIMKKMGKESNFAIMRGRKLLPSQLKKSRKASKMGMMMADPGLLSGGRIIIPIVGNGVFDSLKKLAQKGAQKAKQLGKTAVKSVKQVGRQLKKEGEQLVKTGKKSFSDFAEEEVEKLSGKIETQAAKFTKQLEKGADVATILAADKSRELDELIKKGFTAKQIADISGFGLRPLGTGVHGGGRHGGGTAGNKGFTSVRGISGFRDDLNPGQEKFLESLPADVPTPAFGRDQVTQLNDLILSTELPLASRLQTGGRLNGGRQNGVRQTGGRQNSGGRLAKRGPVARSNFPPRERRNLFGNGLTLL